MPISFRCSGCGQQYQVAETMAGKQAKCRCGATTRVPSEGEDEADDPYGWVAAAMRSPDRAPPAAEPEPASTAKPEPQVPPLAPADFRAEPRRRRTREPGRWHKLVGVVSIAYGALAAVVLLVYAVVYFDGGFFDLFRRTADVVLATAIAVGGVLILKGHRHGPACAGLASIFLCFFPTAKILWWMLGSLHSGELTTILGFLAYFLVVYSIPVAIAAWCLREEMETQKREAEEQD